MSSTQRHHERFSRRFRLRHKREFQAVYGARHRRESGPLLVYALQNDLGHPRLGLSVSRKTGGAVRRVRMKRRLRESFRRLKNEFAEGFDYIVVVRPHDDSGDQGYERHMRSAMKRLIEDWGRSR
ncbi:MAG: ribonuclease P protein component [Phycisphaerae bacterium]|nr:ribonuclease P protein component [Phycisphaerae bacterium]HAW96333.1 ribonuclease P protein component [Phycisphaerales bacterium]